MANRVFDDRLGIYVIDAGRGVDRLAGIKALGIVDVFLPHNALSAHVQAVKQAGLYAHLWFATDGLSAPDYASRTLATLARLGARGTELNIELTSDEPLRVYTEVTIRRIRAVRPALRIRINVAPWKGFALTGLNWGDPNLFAAMQTAEGNMDNLLSPADMLNDLLNWGVPRERCTICYAAACQVAGSPERLRTLPDLSRTRRGVIFSDDLLHDVGMLP